MRLLFLMRHSGYVRNFESAIRELCARGHEVHLAFQGKTKYAQLDPANIAAQLEGEYPGFSYGDAPRRTDGWGLLGHELRLGLDYLRYLGPEYDAAPKLRRRAAASAPASLLEETRHGFGATGLGRQLVMARLRMANAAIPTDPAIDAYLDEMRPDVLAVTPLIEPGSPQSEYLRSARAKGIRTVHCVASWDNLTNKGLIHGPVDLVTVWNAVMKREAVEMHGVPADRVAVTGAAAFDHWFGWQPGGSRDAFCARAGLPADRPYVLYVCSSKFVAPEEVPFVRTWLAALREQGGVLRDVGVLVRPHPQNAEQWAGVDLGILGPAAVWPRDGAAPAGEATRADYYDSIFHSAAVVGINTTAEIESAIVGRPVHTVLAPEFRETQDGTLHFHYLSEAGGGAVHVARDLAEHRRLLEASLRDPSADRATCRAFVERFVRPHGLGVAATPRLADALELVAARPAVPQRPPVWASFVRRRLEPRAEMLAREAPAAKAPKVQPFRGAAKKQRRTKEEWGQRQGVIADVVRHFEAMGENDKRTVIDGIAAHIPAASLLELYGANKPRRLDYDHARIYLRVTSKTETYRVKACAKEPFTIDWIHSRVRAGDVVYDIGANVGAYSFVAARKPNGGAARVYSFEASAVNAAALSINVALNGLSGVVIPMPVALSDHTGMDVFKVRGFESGAARHALGVDGVPDESPDDVISQPVLVYRLDDLVEQFGLLPPTHIKLDVDGGELAVLTGAARTLASPDLRSVLVEVSTSLSESVTEVLGRSGLRLEAKIAKRNKAGEYAVWYGLFGRGGDPAAPVIESEHHEPGKG